MCKFDQNFWLCKKYTAVGMARFITIIGYLSIQESFPIIDNGFRFPIIEGDLAMYKNVSNLLISNLSETYNISN